MPKEYKAPRSLPEIQMEYARLCSQAGDLQFKIEQFRKDLGLVNGQLRDLMFEDVARQGAEAKAKADADAAKAKAAAEAPATTTTETAPQSQGEQASA